MPLTIQQSILTGEQCHVMLEPVTKNITVSTALKYVLKNHFMLLGKCKITLLSNALQLVTKPFINIPVPLKNYNS